MTLIGFPSKMQVTLGSGWKGTTPTGNPLTTNDVIALTELSPGIYTEDGTGVPSSTNRIRLSFGETGYATIVPGGTKVYDPRRYFSVRAGSGVSFNSAARASALIGGYYAYFPPGAPPTFPPRGGYIFRDIFTIPILYSPTFHTGAPPYLSYTSYNPAYFGSTPSYNPDVFSSLETFVPPPAPAIPSVDGILFSKTDSDSCLDEKGVTPSAKEMRHFTCKMSGVVAFANGDVEEFLVNVRSRTERGGFSGTRRFIVENPFQAASTLAFRRLCKDKLDDVTALFNKFCSGTLLYTDTTTLDGLPEKPVASYTMGFDGIVSFADNDVKTFNVTHSSEDNFTPVPNNEGDIAFSQLLGNSDFKDALEEALNQIM